MNSNIPPPATPPVGGPAGIPVPKRRPWLLYGCGLLLGLLLLVCATVAITVWYVQRPIKPVMLSAAEKAAVEKKLEHVGDGQRAPTAKGAMTRSEPDRPTVTSRFGRR